MHLKKLKEDLIENKELGSSQVNGISQVECVELEERKQRAEEPQHEMTTIN